MTALSHSPLLYALGIAIANSLWQMASLWLFYQLFFGISKNTKPTTRHLAATILLFTGFTWFMVTFLNKFIELKSVQKFLVSLPATTDSQEVATQSFFNWNSLTSLTDAYLPYLSAAYLIILLFLSIRLLNAFAYSHKLRTAELIVIDERWQNLVRQLVHRLNINRDVRIYLSGLIDVPATMGFVKPIILLPLATFNHLSVSQVEAVIIHEMAHIRRYDYLVNLLVASMETILFFNPFTQLLSGILKKEREMCCDDLVVRLQRDPHNYAAALLSLEKMRLRAVPALAIAATGNKDQLLNRVKRILNIKSQSLNYGQKLLALVVVAGFISSLAWLSPVPQKKQPLSNDEKLAASVNLLLRDSTSKNKKVFVVKDGELKDRIIDLAKNRKKIDYQADNMYFRKGDNADTVFFEGNINWENLPEKMPHPFDESGLLISPVAPAGAYAPGVFYRQPYPPSANTEELLSKLSQLDAEHSNVLFRNMRPFGAEEMNAADIEKMKKSLEHLDKELLEYNLKAEDLSLENKKIAEQELANEKVIRAEREQILKAYNDAGKLYKEQKMAEQQNLQQYFFDLKTNNWRLENLTPTFKVDSAAKKMMRKIMYPRKERWDAESHNTEEMWQFFGSDEQVQKDKKTKEAERKNTRRRQPAYSFSYGPGNAQVPPTPSTTNIRATSDLAPVTVVGQSTYSINLTSAPRVSVNGVALVPTKKNANKNKTKETKTIIRIITEKGTFDVELDGDDDRDDADTPSGD